MSWIDTLSRKYRHLAIPSLMKYIVISMGAVVLMDLLFRGMATGLLVFDRAAIFSGQIWRVISFIFIPVQASLLFMVFILYFYWMIGEALEREWGVARFNLFYLIGILGTIAAGFVTGYATNHFLNMSLFFAFAILYPNFELSLFFVLPVKIKWLAYLNAAYFVYMFIISGWPQRLALIISVANIILFFWKDSWRRLDGIKRKRQWNKHFR